MQRGLPDRDLSNQEMESQLQSRNIEDEFIMVESNINKFKKRKSMVRQINEGIMGVN